MHEKYYREPCLPGHQQVVRNRTTQIIFLACGWYCFAIAGVAGDKGLVVLPAQIELAREDRESEEFADRDSHIPRASWSIKKNFGNHISNHCDCASIGCTDFFTRLFARLLRHERANDFRLNLSKIRYSKLLTCLCVPSISGCNRFI